MVRSMNSVGTCMGTCQRSALNMLVHESQCARYIGTCQEPVARLQPWHDHAHHIIRQKTFN